MQTESAYQSRFIKRCLEKEFEASNRFMRYMHLLAPGAMVLFLVADYLRYPNGWIYFGLFRLIFIFFTFLTAALYKKAQSYTVNQLISAGLCLYTSIGISVLFSIFDTPETIYANGLNLVALIGLTFAILQIRFFIISIFAVYAPYYILCWLEFDKVQNHTALLTTIIINVCTIVCIYFIRQKYRYDLSELIKIELNLEDEIQNRQKIIIEKTHENVRLEKLSAQFSPQVLEAIKRNLIDFELGLHRHEICAIFIDIVDSTQKINFLSENQFQKSLTRFIEITISTFLENNLTIDKFMGDGIIAFSNMPIPDVNYIDNVCAAAIEVRKRLNLEKVFFQENWKGELAIRIGIASGFANVGFYGDKNFFKTYSAIGTAMPLASRLCSASGPGQILISQSVAEKISQNKFKLNSTGIKNLKGFSEEQSHTFEILTD